MQARVILPMEVHVTGGGEVNTKPVIAGGVAVQKSEYMAMGLTPGCNGCKAIIRGDAQHKSHSPECREHVLEWLKRQEGANIQARLTAAQMRQEAGKEKEAEKKEDEVNRNKMS